IAHQQFFVQRGFRGIEVSGTDAKGRAMQERLVALGDGLLIAGISAAPGQLDAGLARRFLDGCRFEIPWRVFPFAEDGFTVSVPANVIELDQSAMKLDADTHGRAFVLGGTEELTYFIAASPINWEAQPNADRDALLDRVVEALTEDGGTI